MRDRSHLLPAVLAALVLTACGTTVPLSQQSVTAGGSPGAVDPLTGEVVPTQDLGAVPTSGSELGGVVPGGTGGTAGEGTSESGTAGGGSAGTSDGGAGGTGRLPTSGPVRSGGTVVVGLTYFKDASAGLNSIGVEGTLGDQLAYAKVVVADANKRGGLGGKKIVPVYFGYDANPGAASIPDQDNAACQTFTQDNKVELVVNVLANGSNLTSCLARKGIPMVAETNTGAVTAATYAKTRILFDVGGFNLDRRAREQVKALVDQKWNTPWNSTTGGPGSAPVKVGVLSYDTPDYKAAVTGSLTTALRNAGLGTPEVVFVAPHSSYDAIAQASGQVQSAVLKFKALGVTHVVVYDDNGVATLLFLTNAENQSYRPRYGVNSGNNMNLLVEQDLVGKAQLTGVVGMGWVPTFDLPEADSGPGSRYDNPARKACNATMARAGQSGSKYNELFAQQYCASMAVVKAAADRAGTSPGPLVAAIEALGATVPDGLTPGTFLGPRQHDGNGGIYHFAYDKAQDKMVYTSGVIALTRP